MKRALLIGIDTYPHIRTLDGCVNDARLVRRVLVETFGFDEAHVTLLANEQATRAATSPPSMRSSPPPRPATSWSCTTPVTARR